MTADAKQFQERNRAESSIEIESVLAKIEGEEVPQRLLALAQELQNALNLCKRKWVMGEEQS